MNHCNNDNIKQVIGQIIHINMKIAKIWSNAKGWAPDEVAKLLSRSRLDLQVSLSHTLLLWIKPKVNDGHIRLAWANIGALLEGSLKWFLAVYYKDYLANPVLDKNRKPVDPDDLKLEQLKQFYAKSIEHIHNKHKSFIEKAQYRRNGIHTFKNRDIGSQDEVITGICNYLDFLFDIEVSVPWPD